MSLLEITGNVVNSIFATNPLSNPPILISIALVLIIAAILAVISKLLKQQFILAYILTGIILGPLVLGLVTDRTLINGFAEVGICLLLFAAGLEMSLKKLKETIGTSMISGVVQVVVVSLISFFVLIALSFSRVEALWLGIAIAFSSTVVVTKILSDRNELNTLHARFIVGIMLTQDVIAILALAVLTKNLTLAFLLVSLLKISFLLVLAFLFFYLLKILNKRIMQSIELLFIVSLAILFLFVSLAHLLDLSIAIGAFIAGLLLANSSYKLEIETRTRALRDFFSVMFFVSVGLLLTHISTELFLLTIPILLILIIVEPFITALVLKIKGYNTKTSMDIGFSFAQLSEFTLILCLGALSLGIITQRAFDLIVLVAVLSIAATPYTMKLTKPLYSSMGRLLDLIKISSKKEMGFQDSKKKTILIFGCHRMGSIYLKNLEKYQEKIHVIDFNPEIIQAVSKKRISCTYGDANNEEFLDKLSEKDLKIVISTVPRKDDNLLIIKSFKERKPNIFVVATAQKIDEALEFYKAGADYVLLPIIIGAEQCLNMIKNLNKKEFSNLKSEHIKYLQDLHRYLY